MNKKDAKEEILRELSNAYPELKISMLATQQRGDRSLIVVKGFSEAGNIDDWSVDTVYPIWWKMIDILDKYEDGQRDFRLLFVRGNQFMLHSPDVGFGDVFREFKKPLRKDVYSYFEQQHYVGECQNIQDVIEYFTTTKIWF